MVEHAQTLPAIAAEKSGAIMEAVIAKGDIAKLDPNERAKYYVKLCESMGLNPMSRPFEYITLNGKLTLYARKDATDQLRKIYGVSVVEMTENERDGLIIVTVKVKDNAGRTDMAKGAVTLKGLQGEALANAFMKCETKAKRRATLSICGLGFLDETEIETIPTAKRERLPKKDARDIYKRLQAEVDLISIRADFDRWCEENEQRIAVLPEDWEEILRLRIQERRVDIQRAEPPEGEVIWDDETPPEWDSAWEKLGPVKQAGILCGDQAFWKFINWKSGVYVAHHADSAANFVRGFCGIESRKELATNDEAAKKWRDLVAGYRAWQREPSVIEEQASAHNPGDRAADTAAPAPPSSAQAGAAEVHEDEIERLARIDHELTAAAAQGWKPLKARWDKVSDEDAPTFQAAMDNRHKPKALDIERARKEAADA